QAVATLCCITRRARGFSFVVFTDPCVAERVTMEKTPSMAARLRQRRLCLEMIRHLLMTYLFGDETEEEKKVAEGSEAAKKDTKKPKEKKLVSVGYGIKKLTIIHQARMTKAE
ncbi:hypothetical protein HID58_079335, partial [Brassica napus]